MSLKKQEYLANVDVVFTGFFKSAEQVDAAEKAVRIAKEANPNVSPLFGRFYASAKENMLVYEVILDTPSSYLFNRM